MLYAMMTLAEATQMERAAAHEVNATVVNKGSARKAQFQHRLADEAELGRGTVRMSCIFLAAVWEPHGTMS